ncbi:unnamed protein product [Sphagnum compactum]
MDSNVSSRSPHEINEAPRDGMEVIQTMELEQPAVEQDIPLTIDPSTPKSCSSSPIPAPTTVNQEPQNIAQVLMMKLSGLCVPEVKQPPSHIFVPSLADEMSGCSQCEESEDNDDDLDICSSTTSSDDTNQLEGNSEPGFQPPMLPDLHLHVPLETDDDIARVRRALTIKGVLEISCDLQRQMVTVSGNVSPRRLLKKVKKVKPNSRILSTTTSAGQLGTSTISNTMWNPPPLPALNNGYNNSHADFEYYQASSQEPMLVAPRPRPSYESYTFRNRPSSPYLRNYSPSDMSPPSSPPDEDYSWSSSNYYHTTGSRSYAPTSSAANYYSLRQPDGIFHDYYYD